MTTKDPIREMTEFTVLYCDDIREEKNGKSIFVGVYGTDLVFREFPSFIPKLAIFIRGRVALGTTDKTIKFRVERNEEILMEGETVVPETPTARGKLIEQDGQDERSRRLMDLKIILPPMQFTSPCTLRTIVEFSGMQYSPGKLHISKSKAK